MWFADVEATLPSNKFPAPAPTDNEDRFGKLKFGADWAGKLTAEETILLGYLRPRWEGWVDTAGGPVDARRTEWRYEGPEEFRTEAEKLKDRAARGNEQLAHVRRGLRLLRRFGEDHVPPLGTPYQYAFDPLDPVAEMDPDDRALLVEFRVLYWRVRADAVVPAAPVETSIRSESKRRPIPDRVPTGKVERAAYNAIKQKWGAVGGPPATMSNQEIANTIKINCSAETIRRALKPRE
jgi:hypothetical protein